MKKSLTKSIRIPQRSFAKVVPVTVPPLAAVLSDVKSAFFGLCVHARQRGACRDDGRLPCRAVRSQRPARR